MNALDGSALEYDDIEIRLAEATATLRDGRSLRLIAQVGESLVAVAVASAASSGPASAAIATIPELSLTGRMRTAAQTHQRRDYVGFPPRARDPVAAFRSGRRRDPACLAGSRRQRQRASLLLVLVAFASLGGFSVVGIARTSTQRTLRLSDSLL